MWLSDYSTMLFGEPAYFCYLALACFAVWMAAPTHRYRVLIVANLLFILSAPGLSILVYLPVVSSYFFAQKLEDGGSASARLWLACLAVVLNLLPFFAFKIWFGFHDQEILVPLGLSFYTLVLTGYILDVYWRKSPCARRFGPFCAFATFFPAMTAGPIERSNTLLPQMERIEGYEHSRVRAGVLILLVGLIKKTVLASSLAPAVDAVFLRSGDFTGGELWIATMLARYQLFFDFSGYTDIALGSAAVLGLTLSPNFDRPFAARSIADFWRRWHMTLSAWMRDYVFYPFISGPGRFLGVSGSLIFTFIVLGLWHRFSWSFLCFGAAQGILLAAHAVTAGRRPRAPAAFQIAFMFVFLASLPMIFFRSENLAQSYFIFSHLFSKSVQGNREWFDLSTLSHTFSASWIQVAGLVLVYESFSALNARMRLISWLERQPVPVRWAVYLALILSLVAFGNFEAPVDFAYRKF